MMHRPACSVAFVLACQDAIDIHSSLCEARIHRVDAVVPLTENMEDIVTVFGLSHSVFPEVQFYTKLKQNSSKS